MQLLSPAIKRAHNGAISGQIEEQSASLSTEAVAASRSETHGGEGESRLKRERKEVIRPEMVRSDDPRLSFAQPKGGCKPKCTNGVSAQMGEQMPEQSAAAGGPAAKPKPPDAATAAFAAAQPVVMEADKTAKTGIVRIKTENINSEGCSGQSNAATRSGGAELQSAELQSADTNYRPEISWCVIIFAYY